MTKVKQEISDAMAKCVSQVDHLVSKVITDGDWMVRMEGVQALAVIGTEPAVEAVKGVVLDKDYKVRTEVLETALKKGYTGMADIFIQALRDDWWQVRSVAIRAIREKKIYKAVEALIQALSVEDGRLTLDIDDALKVLTGKRYYGDADLWRRWWALNKEKFEKEIAAGKIPESAKAAEANGGGHKGPVATTSFYGIKTASKRIIFVLDISGSMAEKTDIKPGEPLPGPKVTGKGSPGGKDPSDRFKPKDDTKIEVAKCELKKAIANLSKDGVFNIVFYRHEVEVYKQSVFKASKGAKEAAYRFIDGQKAIGGTNIHDALKAAFQVVMPEKGKGKAFGDAPEVTGKGKKKTKGGVDTIFFLTDGKPTAGQVTEPQAILEAVKLWNGIRKIQIHTVGIGDHDADFLQRLAEQNGGTYVKR
ncbi:MAG: hypothetical protein ACYTHN_12465 [Planctomycetota bacterium]|jgi:hypothetical protein